MNEEKLPSRSELYHKLLELDAQYAYYGISEWKTSLARKNLLMQIRGTDSGSPLVHMPRQEILTVTWPSGSEEVVGYVKLKEDGVTVASVTIQGEAALDILMHGTDGFSIGTREKKVNESKELSSWMKFLLGFKK